MGTSGNASALDTLRHKATRPEFVDDSFGEPTGPTARDERLAALPDRP